jgi:hypothetical protein
MNQFLRFCFVFNCILCSCNTVTDTPSVLTDHTAKVLIMLAPDCPLCKNYTLDIRELVDEYKDEIHFYGVIPDPHYTKHEVDSFLLHYEIDLEIVYDSDLTLTHQLGATITPEVFLIDEYNKVIYEGKFDNWLGELGRRRQIITRYYLKDALESYREAAPILIPKTIPIGCFIE